MATRGSVILSPRFARIYTAAITDVMDEMACSGRRCPTPSSR
jgi:hypothetical protein